MAQRELLQHISIPPENIHRMKAELSDLRRAATEYEETLRRNLPRNLQGYPCFDLILLGMGPDGHTASLFPGKTDPSEPSAWVDTPLVEKLQAHRMTLTLEVLNAAREVIFLVTGADKAEPLRAVIKGAVPPLPAQLITVPHGHRLYLVDESTASLLQT
jgi:6-phosphogluconolactonase